MKARVAKVVRPLASVFEMVESGHKVVFDDEEAGGSKVFRKAVAAWAMAIDLDVRVMIKETHSRAIIARVIPKLF